MGSISHVQNKILERLLAFGASASRLPEAIQVRRRRRKSPTVQSMSALWVLPGRTALVWLSTSAEGNAIGLYFRLLVALFGPEASLGWIWGLAKVSG